MLSLRNSIIAGVRTGVQRLIAIGIAAAATWSAAHGFDIDFSGLAVWLLLSVDVVLTGVVTSALNALEKRFPWLTPLLSLGAAASPPKYEKPPASSLPTAA